MQAKHDPKFNAKPCELHDAFAIWNLAYQSDFGDDLEAIAVDKNGLIAFVRKSANITELCTLSPSGKPIVIFTADEKNSYLSLPTKITGLQWFSMSNLWFTCEYGDELPKFHGLLIDKDGKPSTKISESSVGIWILGEFATTVDGIAYMSALASGKASIVQFNLNTGGLAELTPIGMQAKDPVTIDGKTLFFLVATSNNSREIYKMDLDSKEIVSLTRDQNAFVRCLSLGPSGQLAFVSRKDGRPGIFVMDSFGKKVTRISNKAASFLHWSQNGHLFAVSSDESARSAIYRLDLPAIK